MLLTLASLAIAVVCFYIVIKSTAVYNRLLKEWATPSGALPIIGHSLELWGDHMHVFRTLRKFRKEGGTQFITKLMSEVSAHLSDAVGAETVMTSSKHITKGVLYTFLEPWLGRGLLTNAGSSWHHRRKLLTPAFHFKILDEFGPLIARHTARLVSDLKDMAESTKGPVDIVLTVSKITLGTICETAMGVNLHACGKEEEYFKSIRKVGISLTYRLIRPWLWRDFVFNLTAYGREVKQSVKYLHGFTKQVIQERKRSHKEDESLLNEEGKSLRKRRLAFLDMLIAAQKEDPSLTDENIREEVDTFMFEGHETTSMAICWTLFCLGNHPDIQDRVREEVLGASEGWQSIVALPYLEMVLKESLRMFPPVPYIQRENEKGITIGDKKLPAGVNLDLHIFHIHRDPAVFPDPERFDPERFDPEEERSRHPFAYVPFSGGLRNCIGKRYAMMELKIMVAAVVKNFSFRSKLTLQEIEYYIELVLRPKEGIELHMTLLP